MKFLVAFVLPALLTATVAQAGPCDYRPSKVAAATASEVVNQVKAVGAFALTNAATGGSLLGTGAATGAGTTGAGAGASGAGAAGSTHGVIGAALSGTSSVVVAAAAAVGLAGYEGICYFSDRKVTKYNEILGVMRDLAVHADPAAFRLDEGTPGKRDATVTMHGKNGVTETYEVRNLYIDNNELKYNRSFGKDPVVGHIDFVPVETEALPPGTTATTTAPAAPADPPAAAQPEAPSQAAQPAPETPDTAPAAN